MYSLADFFLDAYRLVLVRTLGCEVPFFGLVSVCVLKVERGKYSIPTLIQKKVRQ